MNSSPEDRRKYDRYDTQVKIYFQVTYDIKTRVRFQLIDKEKREPASDKYSAVSRNVSAEGLAFMSDKQLVKGDLLYIEVYLPAEKEPVQLEGEVVWSREAKEKHKFDSAVKLNLINGKNVSSSIYWDDGYKLFWSNVLEAILGSFRIFAQKKAAEKDQ